MNAVLLLLAEAAVVAGLHVAGRRLSLPGGDVLAWLETASPEDAVAAVAWGLALPVAWWLLVATVLHALACAAGTARAGLTGRLLPAALRGVVERTLAGTVVAASVGAPVWAQPSQVAQPPVLEVVTAAPEPVPEVAPPLVPPGVSPPAVVAPSRSPPDATAGASRPSAATPPQQPRRHTVRPGECLWTIAADALGGDATVGEVAAYWLRVIEANHGRLRSGDPDLIYPGEQVLLP